MKKLMTYALAAAMTAGVSMGADIRYMGSGDWSVDANWVGGLKPTTLDTGRMNWGNNTVTVTTTETCGRVQIGVDESGTLVIANGGSLTTTTSGGLQGRIYVGNNNLACQGTLTVQAGGYANCLNGMFVGAGTVGIANIYGTVDLGSHLWMGSSATGDGTLNIYNGGILNVAGNTGLGTVDAVNASGGNADMYVFGGTVNLHHWNAVTSIQNGSTIHIDGTGAINIGYSGYGDQSSVVADYVTAGKIIADSGSIQTSYNAGTGITTITVPEPATIGMLGLGAFATLLIRRMKARS
jgi:hypothetical protein